jgi:hypothetical protein
MTKEWKNKSCGTCEFKIRGYCYRFPPNNQDTEILDETKACAEWRQEVNNYKPLEKKGG